MSKSITSLLVLAAAAFTLVLGPGSAFAKPCSQTVPSSNSELDQYVETIPGACGDTQVGGGSGSAGGSGGGGGSTGAGSAVVPLAESTQEALDALGPDGEAAARLAEETTPSPSEGSPSGGGSETATGSNLGLPAGTTVPAPPDSSIGFSPGSAISGILGALSGGSDAGLGVAAPIVLVAIALGGLAFLLLRRRSPA